MRAVSGITECRPGSASTIYTSYMHNERTRIEVFSRVPDNAFRNLVMGPMELIRMRCGTISIRREVADIRTRPNRMLTFVLQSAGQGTFRHYGHEIALGEGDFALCNNSTYYDLRLEEPSEALFFRVPTPLVQAIIPTPEMLCGLRLPVSQGLASMAGAMARDLIGREGEPLPEETLERAGRHLLDVLASSYLPLLDDRSSGSAVMTGRFWKVKVFIEEHLRDPELSPSFIARQMRLSDRYLRMIFSAGDESPSAYILRRRLEECAAQLRDPRWQSHSITNIAFGWGFNSASHFTRSFRAQFFCSPREYRHQRLS